MQFDLQLILDFNLENFTCKSPLILPSRFAVMHGPLQLIRHKINTTSVAFQSRFYFLHAWNLQLFVPIFDEMLASLAKFVEHQATWTLTQWSQIWNQLQCNDLPWGNNVNCSQLSSTISHDYSLYVLFIVCVVVCWRTHFPQNDVEQRSTILCWNVKQYGIRQTKSYSSK